MCMVCSYVFIFIREILIVLCTVNFTKSCEDKDFTLHSTLPLRVFHYVLERMEALPTGILSAE